MAEPLAVIGIIGSSLTAVVQAKDFVDSIRRAPQSVQTLSDDLRAIVSLLRELDSLLNAVDDRTRQGAHRLVRETRDSCERVARRVDVVLRPFVRSTGASLNVWQRFSFRFQQSDVVELQRDMAACKQTLNISISFAHWWASHFLSAYLSLPTLGLTISCSRL